MFLPSSEVLAKRVEEGIKSYDLKKVTTLITDFCKHGVGFLLLQKHCPSKKLTNVGRLNVLCCKTGWKVCMVSSRFTKKPEANHSPTEGVLLVVVNALKKVTYFTLGCPVERSVFDPCFQIILAGVLSLSLGSMDFTGIFVFVS